MYSLFFTLAVGGQCHAPPALYPRKRPSIHSMGGRLGPRVSMDGCAKSCPTGIRSLDHPACSEFICNATWKLSGFMAVDQMLLFFWVYVMYSG